MKNYKKELKNAQQDVIAETQGCLKEIAVEVNDVIECLKDVKEDLYNSHGEIPSKFKVSKQIERLQALYDSLT